MKADHSLVLGHLLNLPRPNVPVRPEHGLALSIEQLKAAVGRLPKANFLDSNFANFPFQHRTQNGLCPHGPVLLTKKRVCDKLLILKDPKGHP